jgi:leucyl aminopeptidase
MPYLSGHTNTERFIIELSSGEKQEVTEAEKFSLKRVCTCHMRDELQHLTYLQKGVNFIDVTAWPNTAHLRARRPRAPLYPTELMQGATVEHINAFLDPGNMRRNLEMFTSFTNRYYQSNTGNLSAEWLLGQVSGYVEQGSPVNVSIFQHAYRQSSIVATIPGKSTKTIVVGAHMDSINGAVGENRTTARAPGAGM